MKEMIYRQATLRDVAKIVALEEEAWPETGSATRKMFQSRISTFPDGNVVAEKSGRIIGVVSVEIVQYDFEKKPLTWKEVTDNGLIKKTHRLDGNVMYGVDLSVLPEFRNKGVGKRLLQEIGRMAIRKNIPFGVLGGRLPDYHKYADRMSIDEYLQAKNSSGEALDSELRFYQAADLEIRSPIPDYFPDPESLNYGVLLVWRNPFYCRNVHMGKILGWFAQKIFRL